MVADRPDWTRTSGDIIADRRYGYAEALLVERDWAAASDLFRQVIDIAPKWPPAHFGLGRALVELGDTRAAGAALATCLSLDPDDRQGARVLLARLAGKTTSGSISDAYVAQLFDDYAPHFDSHLVKKLAYRAPELLMEALDETKQKRLFRTGIDLGCGTGLMATALAGRCAEIHGVDLSAGMLAKADASGLYATLHRAELLEYLSRLPIASADLILAADVFCYVPALAPAFAECARVLEPGGVLAFTVQTHSGDGAVIGHDQRVHHAMEHVSDLLVASGLSIVLSRAESSRHDAGVAVPGALFLARKP